MKLPAEIESEFAKINIPDRSDIVEWCSKHICLPSPPYSIAGALDLSLSQYLVEPIRSLQNDKVREVVCCASPRTGKTLLSDAYILYCLKKDPADILLCFHTRDILKAFYDVRFLKLLKTNGIIDLTADRFDATQKLIRLPDSTVRFVTVATENSLTALGARVVIADECWRYGPGIIPQIKNRTLDYRYSKKMLFISQGSDEGTDFHSEWKQGQQAYWGFQCPYCNSKQKFYLAYKRNDNTFAGLTWDTNDYTKPNGTRDIPRTLETVHYKCISCNAKFFENDRRLLNKSGCYIPGNPNAKIDIRSYTWNAFACNSIAFEEIAKTYLLAKHDRLRGKHEAFRNFYLQEMAAFWNEGVGLEKYNLKVNSFEEGEETIDTTRISTVDVQMHGNLLYYTICEFNKLTKSIKLIAYGKTDSFDAMNQINKEHNVKDQCVLVDSGDSTRIVYTACAKHGHLDKRGKWFCWTATKGETPQAGTYYDPQTKRNTFYSRPKLQDVNVGDGKKLFCPFRTFNANTGKDILKALLDNSHPDFKLYMSESALADEEFKSQLHAEHRVMRNGKYTWVTIKENIDNHYFDCLVLQCVAGGILGFL